MKRLVAVLVLSACSRRSPAPSATGAATNAQPVATNAAAAPAPPAASASSSAAAAAPAGCDLRWGFHGTVAGQEAFLRLARVDGGALKGRYFYAKVGVDIPLEGSLDAASHLQLVEGDPQKPTGTFTGTCDLATGTLEGSWSAKKPSAKPFRFERVGPRPAPLVAKKKRVVTAKPRTPGPMKMGCRCSQELVEIFGAGTPETEALLNQQGATEITTRPLPEGCDCETGIEAETTEDVLAAFRGIVTIRRATVMYSDGAPHPMSSIELTTYDLETGREVTAAELWAAIPTELVKRCDTALFGEPDAGDDFLAAMWPDGRTFDLTERGVHIYSTGYPQFAHALDGEGPTLAWGALLREGALRADSPVKRAWEGVAKAKPGAPECFDGDGKVLR